jgi:hypothetical protein
MCNLPRVMRGRDERVNVSSLVYSLLLRVDGGMEEDSACRVVEESSGECNEVVDGWHVKCSMSIISSLLVCSPGCGW